MEENLMVQGEPNGTVTPEVTPAGGVAAPATTPTTTPSDAENAAALAAQQALELKAELEKAQRDINQVKSTFQQREARLQKEWSDRQKAYESEMERLKVSGMDEEQRKAYEASAASRRVSQLEQQLQEIENQKSQTEAMFKAQNYFLANGVPAERLVLDGGYDELWNSGMTYITSELQRLKSQPAAAPTKPATQLQQAPAVVTATNTPAYLGPTWPDLVKQYGSEEEVYRLVETGRLDASVLPVPK